MFDEENTPILQDEEIFMQLHNIDSIAMQNRLMLRQRFVVNIASTPPT
jgi:hypothetical protein